MNKLQLVLEQARAAPCGLERRGGIDGEHVAAVGPAGVALCAARTRLAAPGRSGSTAAARHLVSGLWSSENMGPCACLEHFHCSEAIDPVRGYQCSAVWNDSDVFCRKIFYDWTL